MEHKRFSIIVILIALTFAFSCEGYLDQFKNFGNIDTEIEIEPSTALPIAYGSFSLQDVLESVDSTGFVDETEEGLIYVYYADTLVTLSAVDFLDSITDTKKDFIETYFKSDVEIPAWVSLGIGDTLEFTKTNDIKFTEGASERIDSVTLSGGRLVFDVKSDFHHAGILQISSSNLFDVNGDTLDMDFVISDSAGNYSKVEELDLSDYQLRVTEGNESSGFKMHFVLTLIKSTAGIDIGDECRVTIGFKDLKIHEIYGFISSQNLFNADQSIDLSFFNSFSDALDFSLRDPNFNIFIHNSFGIPITIDFPKFQFRSSKDNQLIDLKIGGNSPKFEIAAPTLDEVGSTVRTPFYLDRDTCNIAQIISELPNLVDLSVEGNSGIDGADSEFFLTDNSELMVEAEIVIPLWLQAGGFTFQDTLDLDLGDVLGDISLIKSADFNVKTINELPLQLELQAYFLDANDVILDSLFLDDNPFILAPDVDDNGDLLDPNNLEENLSRVSITEERLTNIEGTKKLWITAHAFTSDSRNNFVKFYSHYELKYSLSIDAEFRINPGENF